MVPAIELDVLGIAVKQQMRFEVKQRIVERNSTLQLHRLLAVLINLRRHALSDPLLNNPRGQPFISVEQRINRSLSVVPGTVVIVPDVFRVADVAVVHPVVKVAEPLVQADDIVGIQHASRVDQPDSIDHHPQQTGVDKPGSAPGHYARDRLSVVQVRVHARVAVEEPAADLRGGGLRVLTLAGEVPRR